MDQRVKLIVGAVAVVLILVIITIVVFLVSASKQKTQVENEALNSLTKLKVNPSPTQIIPVDNTALPSTDGMSTYTGSNFTLKYQATWGLLTCNNSQNFELDPVNPTSLRGVICNYALKPVTVLVSTTKLNCSGDTLTLGAHTVVKNKKVDGGSIDYRWCVNLSNGTSFDITHRVSQTEGRATSKEDYSTQIEEIIKSLTPSIQAS